VVLGPERLLGVWGTGVPSDRVARPAPVPAASTRFCGDRRRRGLILPATCPGEARGAWMGQAQGAGRVGRDRGPGGSRGVAQSVKMPTSKWPASICSVSEASIRRHGVPTLDPRGVAPFGFWIGDGAPLVQGGGPSEIKRT